MLRVAEQYAGTDTGRQRRANEDSMLARAPLFVVADGMGGAQAGEVASRLAVDAFKHGIEDASEPEAAMAALARAANSRIHRRSHSYAEQAGMGTTLTAVYVGERRVSIAHVGDSRAYRLREGELTRLTEDHSLVDELIRQGRLTPEQAVEHPQRSVITRALGPEGAVDVDTRSYPARAGDVYVLCSDGLTTMIGEDEMAGVLHAHPRLRDAGEALIAAANEAGGRDNITVLLMRLEEVGAPPGVSRTSDAESSTQAWSADAVTSAVRSAREDATVVREDATVVREDAAAVRPSISASPRARSARMPRTPRTPSQNGASAARPRGRARRAAVVLAVLAVLGVTGSGLYLAWQSVYFIGTNDRGLVTIFQGVPFRLPGNLALYSGYFVSGVSASTLSPERRRTLLDHSLRSEGDAAGLVRSLELGQLE